MKLREKESTSIVNTFGKKDEPPLFIQAADRILTDTSLTIRYSFSRIIYLAKTITQFYKRNTCISYPRGIFYQRTALKSQLFTRTPYKPRVQFHKHSVVLENRLKTNLQRDLFPTTLGTHYVGIHSFLFMFLDFLCIYFLNEPAFGRRLHEANAATKINSIYLLKKFAGG